MWYKPWHYFNQQNLADSLTLKSFLGQFTYVWEIVAELEAFIKQTITPNVAAARQGGDFLTEAVAISGRETFRGVQYQLGDPSKGQLRVWHNGQLLPEATLLMPGVILTDDDIEIGPGALVESGALIKGPSIIGAASEVRQGAYVRGGVMSLPGAVIGHTTEVKNSLLLKDAKAGHFAYLGDSILGNNVNLGAGTKLANLKMTTTPYCFRFEDEVFQFARRKLGAIIGDDSETGCNTVLNPGTLLAPGAKVLPNSNVAAGYRRSKTFLDR